MRIGLIGAGFISNFHLGAIRQFNHELVIVADPDEQRAAEAALATNSAYTRDPEEVYKKDLDLVVICAPTKYHFDLTYQAIEAGHNVLCEKTLTRRAENSRRLAELADSKGVKAFVGYMKRVHPTMCRFKEQVQKIGQARSILVRVYHPFPAAGWENVAKTYETDSPYLDGVLVHAGSHMLDLLMHICGPVKKILAARMQFAPGCPKNDMQTHALLEMENGATAMIECGWLGLFGVGRHEHGWDEMLQVRADEGLATLYTNWWNRPDTEPSIAEMWYEPDKTRESYNAGCVDNFPEQYQQIEKALKGEPHIQATVRDGYNVDQLITDIYTASGNEWK